jgi:site-specific recombinase XerD
VEYEKKMQTRHRFVNREDFKKLLSTPMADDRMEMFRHWFIFSSLTGLAYVDARGFYPHHIGKTADGRRYIRINRQKTKVESFIPLHPIAEQILGMYNTTDDEKPVFPLPTLNSAWTDIHEIGFAIGRTENLSAHMARHTFGTMLVSEGICLESIAKMMGHSSVKSTQVYAKVTDDNISRDMDRLQKRREAKGLTTSDTTAEHNKALLQKKLDRPKELLREDPRLAVKKVGRPKKNLLYHIPKD